MLIYFNYAFSIRIFLMYIRLKKKKDKLLHSFELLDKILERPVSQSKVKIQIKQKDNENHFFVLCGKKATQTCIMYLLF